MSNNNQPPTYDSRNPWYEAVRSRVVGISDKCADGISDTPGILSGRIAGEFISRNDLSPDAIRSFSILLVNSEGRVDSSDLHEDGSFELKVPPGLYDVSVYAGGKKFPVQRGFTIREGQRELLEIK